VRLTTTNGFTGGCLRATSYALWKSTLEGLTYLCIHAFMYDFAIECLKLRHVERYILDSLSATHVCSRMLTYAHVCSRMLSMLTYAHVMRTYAHVCSRMLTYAHVMLTYAHACSRNAHVCSRMLTYAHVLLFTLSANGCITRLMDKSCGLNLLVHAALSKLLVYEALSY
jgi:hypothetical protein